MKPIIRLFSRNRSGPMRYMYRAPGMAKYRDDRITAAACPIVLGVGASGLVNDLLLGYDPLLNVRLVFRGPGRKRGNGDVLREACFFELYSKPKTGDPLVIRYALDEHPLGTGRETERGICSERFRLVFWVKRIFDGSVEIVDFDDLLQ